MKEVIIVHGWSGSPEGDWIPWVRRELEARGYKVTAPVMTDTDEPDIDTWVNQLESVAEEYGEDTVFVGHSIGCQTIMRFLEKEGRRAKGAIFVAGWFDLQNLEDDETREIARSWIETPIDLNKVRGTLPKSTLIISDNDPYGALEFNKSKFSELGSKIVELHNAGHITGDDGFTDLPQLIEEVEKF